MYDFILGKLKIGQDVNIRLSGFPDNEYGIVKGAVKEISLLPSNDGAYLLDVSLSEKLITTYNIEIDFKQEMQGIAEIITEDLRLIKRIFYQKKRFSNNENETNIFIRNFIFSINRV